MGLWTKLFGSRTVEKGISSIDQLRLFRADKASVDDEFPPLSIEQQLQAVRNNPIVYACVVTKARAFQQAPLIVEVKDPESGTWGPSEEQHHPLLAPFQNNPDLSEAEMKQYMSMHVDLTGKSYVWLWTDATGMAREGWPVPPSWVTPILVDKLDPNQKQRVVAGFKIRPIGSSGLEWIVPREDVIYTRLVDPANLWDGLSPLCAGRKAMQLDDSGDAYKADAMNSLRLPGVVVKTKKPLNQRQKDDLRAVLKQKIGGDARDNAMMISGDDASVELLNPMKEFDWSTYTSQDETRLCMVFGVPPIVIGALVGLENSPWSNTGEAKRWLYQTTMSAQWALFSDSLTRSRVPEQLRGQVRITFDLTDIKELRDDQDAIVERANKLWGSGMITRNEGREIVGLAATEGGDVYQYPAMVVLTPEEGVEAPEAETELTEEEQAEGVADMQDEEEQVA